MKKLLLFLTIVGITLSASGQKQKLGFNLKAGETYYHLLETASLIKQEVNGQQMNIDISMSLKIAYRIINVRDSIYDMKVSYQRLEMTMNLPNGKKEFDSENSNENDVFSTILSAMTGKEFTVQMSRVGKILSVQNLDSVFGNLFDQFPQLAAEQVQQMKAQLKQAYGEKAFKGSFEMVTAIYSNAAVEKGSTWQITTHLESGMAATLQTTFEWKEKTEAYHLIIGSGIIKTLDKDAYTEISGMPIKYDLAGTMNSVLKVDPKTGWMIEAKINQLITGSAEIKDNPQLPGGMTIPMVLESKMDYSSK